MAMVPSQETTVYRLLGEEGHMRRKANSTKAIGSLGGEPPQCCPASRKKYIDTYMPPGKTSVSLESLQARSLREDSPSTQHHWIRLMSRRRILGPLIRRLLKWTGYIK